MNILVCNLAGALTLFLDNKIGKCRKCKRAIYYRPHTQKRVYRICIECYEKYYINENSEIIITEESVKELKRVLTSN